jgi:hypothetical protein
MGAEILAQSEPEAQIIERPVTESPTRVSCKKVIIIHLDLKAVCYFATTVAAHMPDGKAPILPAPLSRDAELQLGAG